MRAAHMRSLGSSWFQMFKSPTCIASLRIDACEATLELSYKSPCSRAPLLVSWPDWLIKTSVLYCRRRNLRSFSGSDPTGVSSGDLPCSTCPNRYCEGVCTGFIVVTLHTLAELKTSRARRVSTQRWIRCSSQVGHENCCSRHCILE